MAGKDRRQINVKGGGKVYYREIDPTPSNTFIDLGYIKESALNDIYNMIKSIDDAGHKIDNKEAGQEVTFTTKLMQTAKEQIDFQRLAAGKYFDIYIPILLNNGYTQEIRFPVARIVPGAKLEFKPVERTIDITIDALCPKAAFTATPTDYNVTENVPYIMIENAIAKGAPSDTASSLATAVI